MTSWLDLDLVIDSTMLAPLTSLASQRYRSLRWIKKRRKQRISESGEDAFSEFRANWRTARTLSSCDDSSQETSRFPLNRVRHAMNPWMAPYTHVIRVYAPLPHRMRNDARATQTRGICRWLFYCHVTGITCVILELLHSIAIHLPSR